MMEVQKFLRDGKNLDDLNEELGIKYVLHEDGRAILNYHQIDSPKTHPIVGECRGLTLDHKNDWNVVARSFDRFFNIGEHHELTCKFDWSSFDCYTKEDGSLMVLYYHKGKWQVNTRGSFADSECNFSGKTWSELFFELLNIDPMDMDKYFNRKYSYSFEMWTPYNKVVRIYDAPTIILLGSRNNITGEQMSEAELDVRAARIGLSRPERHTFHNLHDIEEFLQSMESNDPTFEGVVVRDNNNLRMKIKNKTYLSLHKMCDNGNLFNPKNILPFVLTGEKDELLTYFPEVEDKYNEIEKLVWEFYSDLDKIRFHCQGIEDQKEFALLVTKKFQTPMSSLFFTLRKKYGIHFTEDQLRQQFRDSQDLLCKILFK